MPEDLYGYLKGTVNIVFTKKSSQKFLQHEGITVTRRFSDFDKLETYLLSVYPFRLLPPLPGKRLALSGYYALADVHFPARRAQGLARFSSALMSHPTLARDELVQAFFRDPHPPSPELYKLASTSNGGEEAMRADKRLTPQQEASVPATLEETLERLKKGQLAETLKCWISIYHAFEQSCRREEAQAAEYTAWSTHLTRASVLDEGLGLAGDRRGLRRDIEAASDALSKRTSLLKLMQSDGLSERFKAHVETYHAMADLLQRHQVSYSLQITAWPCDKGAELMSMISPKETINGQRRSTQAEN